MMKQINDFERLVVECSDGTKQVVYAKEDNG